MPYQLMVKSSKYLPIDIRRHSKFIINSNLKNGSSNLNEIDLFTQQFYDEIDLKKSLIREGLLNPKFINNRIAIRYNHEDTLNDSIVYSDLKAYLDKKTLENTLRILSEDNDFIRLLVDKYTPKDTYTKDKYVVNNFGQLRRITYINDEVLSILNHISKYNIDYIKRFILPYRENIDYIKNIDYANLDIEIGKKALITIFYYNEVYRREYTRSFNYDRTIKDYDDYYEFGKKAQYRNLHNLALFVGNYDLERKKKEEKEYQEEFLEPGEMVFDNRYIVPLSSKPKKRVLKIDRRKKYNLDGQISIFD